MNGLQEKKILEALMAAGISEETAWTLINGVIDDVVSDVRWQADSDGDDKGYSRGYNEGYADAENNFIG